MKKNHCGNINQQNAPKGALKEAFDKAFAFFCDNFTEKEFMMFVKSTMDSLLLNVQIKQCPNLERRNVTLGQVYLVDYGFRIGSELRGVHFVVPYAVSGTMVSVVPLTSKKGNSPLMRVALGSIDGLNDSEAFASIGQHGSVSIARLKAPKVKGNVVCKLRDEQLNAVVSRLQKYITQNYSLEL